MHAVVKVVMQVRVVVQVVAQVAQALVRADRACAGAIGR